MSHWIGLARVTMVESETTCVVEGISGLVWFNKDLGGARNHFFVFALLLAILVLPPCQECGYAPNPRDAGFEP